jgi:hypothetical protein
MDMRFIPNFSGKMIHPVVRFVIEPVDKQEHPVKIEF